MSTRDTLQAALERHQASGDFAAQAETLMQLADMTKQIAVNAYHEDLFSLLQGLCMQACAIYKHLGSKKGMADAVNTMTDAMNNYWNSNSGELMAHTSRPSEQEFFEMYRVAVSIYADLGDIKHEAEMQHMIGVYYEGEPRRIALEQALSRYQDLNDIGKQALMLYRLSYCYPFGSPECLHCLERALELYKRDNNQDSQQTIREMLKRAKQHNQTPRQNR